MTDDADRSGPRATRPLAAAASAVRGWLRRARATLAGGWYDIPSLAARAAAPLRERAGGILAVLRRRR